MQACVGGNRCCCRRCPDLGQLRTHEQQCPVPAVRPCHLRRSLGDLVAQEPCFAGFSSPPDEDGDGFPEIYGRVADDAIGPSGDIVKFIRTEYEGRVLVLAPVEQSRGPLSGAGHPLDHPRPGTGGEARRQAHQAFPLVQGHRRASPRLSHQGRALHPAWRFALAPACRRSSRSASWRSGRARCHLSPST